MRHKYTLPAQSLVEFALIIPIVLALLLGFFDLARAIFYNSSLQNAVRQAARSGMVMDFDEEAIRAKVFENAFGLPVNEDNFAIQIEINTLKDYSGWETLQISAIYCYEPVTPGITSILGNCINTNGKTGIELTASSVMRLD